MANLITLTRFLLIPIFAFFILLDYNIAALVVFLAAAATDWLDGYVARRTKITDFGKIADPIADRILVITATVLLTVKGMIPKPAMTLLITREFVIAIGAALLQIKGITIEVITAGKYATAFVIIALVLILLRMPIGTFFIYAAALFYLAVGCIYIYKTIILLRSVK